jgi:hypothetical protein
VVKGLGGYLSRRRCCRQKTIRVAYFCEGALRSSLTLEAELGLDQVRRHEPKRERRGMGESAVLAVGSLQNV